MDISLHPTQKDLDYRNLSWALASTPLFPEHAATIPIKTVPIEHMDALHAFIAAKPVTRRLGYYFEYLLEYYLRFILKSRVLYSQVVTPQGELDFLFLDPISGRWKHWEVALKFYFYEPENGLYWGQKRQDRLDIKKKRIIERQMNYSKDSSVLEKLEIDPELVDRELFVRGRLFHPFDSSEEIDHRYFSSWIEFQKHEKKFRDCKFKLLDRKEWLANPIEFPLGFNDLQIQRLASMLAVQTPSDDIKRVFILEKGPEST